MLGIIGWVVGRREGVVELFLGSYLRSLSVLKNLFMEELYLFVFGGDWRCRRGVERLLKEEVVSVGFMAGDRDVGFCVVFFFVLCIVLVFFFVVFISLLVGNGVFVIGDV